MPPPQVVSTAIPVSRVGILAIVRNRRGLVAAVEPRGDDAEGLVHLAAIEYLDPDGPREEQLI